MATRYSRRTRYGDYEHYDTAEEMHTAQLREFDQQVGEGYADFALYTALAVGFVLALAFFHFIGDALLVQASNSVRVSAWLGGFVVSMWMTHRLFRRFPTAVTLLTLGSILLLILGGFGYWVFG